MPAHSRPKDGVLSHAYVARIHVLAEQQQVKTWMAGTSPAMTIETQCLSPSCPALCRASTSSVHGAATVKTWMAGTTLAMTV